MTTYPNTKSTMELIKQLVSIPSPSGNTNTIISFVEDYLKDTGYEMYRNRKGGLILSIPGEDGSRHRMLTAHVDTLGAMVKDIKSDGRLKLSMIGGFRWNAVEGEYCTIETSSGKTFSGTILMHQTSVHVYKNAGDAKRDDVNIEVRIDAKVSNPAEVRELGIEVGDFVSFDPRAEITESGYIKSRHLDDKASVGMLLQLIKK